MILTMKTEQDYYKTVEESMKILESKEMIVNMKKNKVTIMGRSEDVLEPIHIKYNGEEFEHVEKCEYLFVAVVVVE